MKKTIKEGSRIILGLSFIIFGLNGFLHFLQLPPLSPAGADFMKALIDTEYLMPVVKTIEILSGLLILLGGKKEFLGLILLGPVLVNIFMFHAVLDTQNLLFPLILTILFEIRLWTHRDKYLYLFV